MSARCVPRQMKYNFENKAEDARQWRCHVPAYAHGQLCRPCKVKSIFTNFERQGGIIPSEDNETPSTPLHMSYSMVLVAYTQPLSGSLVSGI